MSFAAATEFDNAANNLWDVVVIGAGPAGALAARQAARAGLQTLLLDGKAFPRQKVCGGYLNRRALSVLNGVGLDHLTRCDAAADVNQLELRWRKQRAHFRLPTGRTISRISFDAALVDSARLAGAVVLTGVSAIVEPSTYPSHRRITAVCDGVQHSIDARLIICADGLSRTSVRSLAEFSSITASESRVGIGAVVTGALEGFRSGQLKMVLSRRGYVGISRIGPAQFNIAAAIDRGHLMHTSPAEVVSSILMEAGIQLPPEAMNANWRGTSPLTSRPKQVASERVILIGDAGGYVEPFTGEGMATALETAVAVVPLAIEAGKSWSPSLATSWESLHWQLVRSRQRTCQQLAWILRRPWASIATLSACRIIPGIAEQLIAKTSAPTSFRPPTEMSTT